jgi:hypothetical protein
MRLKPLYVSVAGALMLGSAATSLAQQYYVVEPAAPTARERVVVEERIVTTPAQPAVVVPGERIAMSYTADDAYPFPSPETRITRHGVFVPTEPVDTGNMRSEPATWPERSVKTD